MLTLHIAKKPSAANFFSICEDCIAAVNQPISWDNTFPGVPAGATTPPKNSTAKSL